VEIKTTNLRWNRDCTKGFRRSLKRGGVNLKEFTISRLKAIRFALQGWWHVIRTQRNAWIHALVSVLVILLGIWLRLPRRDWAVLILTIAIVWMAEFFNTAVETLTDLVSPGENHLAKVSKDVSAAAVLITAAASVFIGLLILGYPLFTKLRDLILN
jgi:diacylglycerol kinase